MERGQERGALDFEGQTWEAGEVDVLVSDPARLLLVRDTATDSHETTLVVPNLPDPRVTYYRCLVDAGVSFQEHAVVVHERPLGETGLSIIKGALQGARRTAVTFVRAASSDDGVFIESGSILKGVGHIRNRRNIPVANVAVSFYGPSFITEP